MNWVPVLLLLAASPLVLSQDTTDPVIILNGPATLLVGKNQAYTELGAKATDDTDDDATLTAAIVVDSTAVDMSTLGDYAVTYDVSDAASNSATRVTRTVRVTEDDWDCLGAFADCEADCEPAPFNYIRSARGVGKPCRHGAGDKRQCGTGMGACAVENIAVTCGWPTDDTASLTIASQLSREYSTLTMMGGVMTVRIAFITSSFWNIDLLETELYLQSAAPPQTIDTSFVSNPTGCYTRVGVTIPYATMQAAGSFFQLDDGVTTDLFSSIQVYQKRTFVDSATGAFTLERQQDDLLTFLIRFVASITVSADIKLYSLVEVDFILLEHLIVLEDIDLDWSLDDATATNTMRVYFVTIVQSPYKISVYSASDPTYMVADIIDGNDPNDYSAILAADTGHEANDCTLPATGETFPGPRSEYCAQVWYFDARPIEDAECSWDNTYRMSFIVECHPDAVNCILDQSPEREEGTVEMKIVTGTRCHQILPAIVATAEIDMWTEANDAYWNNYWHCTEHDDCHSTEYCDSSEMCWNTCESCTDTYNDAIDGTCPSCVETENRKPGFHKALFTGRRIYGSIRGFTKNLRVTKIELLRFEMLTVLDDDSTSTPLYWKDPDGTEHTYVGGQFDFSVTTPPLYFGTTPDQMWFEFVTATILFPIPRLESITYQFKAHLNIWWVDPNTKKSGNTIHLSSGNSIHLQQGTSIDEASPTETKVSAGITNDPSMYEYFDVEVDDRFLITPEEDSETNIFTRDDAPMMQKLIVYLSAGVGLLIIIVSAILLAKRHVKHKHTLVHGVKQPSGPIAIVFEGQFTGGRHDIE